MNKFDKPYRIQKTIDSKKNLDGDFFHSSIVIFLIFWGLDGKYNF